MRRLVNWIAVWLCRPSAFMVHSAPRLSETKRIAISGMVHVSIELCLVAVASTILVAQHESDKINSHLGVVVNVPMNPTARYVHTGWGLLGGAGYNFSKHHSVIGEFMWSRVYATDGALEPLRSASQNSSLTGTSNLYVVTGNYRYEWRTTRFGAYFLGGGGLYYRITNLSEPVTAGTTTPCAPAWIWWGFNCQSGLVMANQRRASDDSSAFGGNGGVGVTMRVGPDPYRLYIESRYHYAPNKNISTQLITITVGIRY